MTGRTLRSEKGFALLEALIAALVLSLGVLTIVALQARTVNEYRDSKMRQYATILAADLVDRIRANRAAAASYDSSNLAAAADTVCASSAAAPCADEADMAKDDLHQWKAWLESLGFNVNTGVPADDTSVSVDASVTPVRISITMRWASRGGVQTVPVNTEVL